MLDALYRQEYLRVRIVENQVAYRRGKKILTKFYKRSINMSRILLSIGHILLQPSAKRLA